MPHDLTPPASPDPTASGVPWEDLERLAAGELRAEDQAALGARVEADVEWAQAFARVTAIQERLDAVPLHAVPLGLVRGVMEAVSAMPRARRLRWPQIAAGWAAVVLVSLASWIAVSGTTPALADGAPPSTWVASVDTPEWLTTEGDEFERWQPTLLLPVVSEAVPRAAWLWLLGGLLLLGLGTLNALRMHRHAAGGAA